MFKMLLGNRLVLFNLLKLAISVAVGAGLLTADSVTDQQLMEIVGGLLALVAIGSGVNATAHHRAGRVDVQPNDSASAAAGNGPSNPVDPGGA